MKGTVTVRKNRAQRVGVCLICAGVWVAALICVLSVGQPLLLLAALPALIPAGVLMVHFLTWRITFSADGVTFRRHSCPYSRILRAEEAYSPTLLRYITLYPADRRPIRFRLEDENAPAAVKMLKSHMSVFDR